MQTSSKAPGYCYLTGTKTGQVLGHNAVAIRDTNNNDVDVDVSTLPGMKALIVSNTTNQNVSISLYAKASNYSFASLSGSNKTVNAGSSLTITDSDMPGLRSPLPKLTIRATFSVAPTSGSVSSYIEGVVN